MRPIRLTWGRGEPSPDPGWTFLEGGAADYKLGPFSLVYLSMTDPEERVWLEWFFARRWMPFGIRVLVASDRRFLDRRGP